METEGSLPHSQQHTTCPHPESNQSSPCHVIPFLKHPFQYSILPSMPGSSKWSLSPLQKYLFIYSLFSDVNSQCINKKGGMGLWITDWKDCRRKWSWPNLRNCAGICLEGLRKTTQCYIRWTHIPAERGIQDTMTREKCYPSTTSFSQFVS